MQKSRTLISAFLLAVAVGCAGPLHAQDLGSLAVFVGNPNKDNAAAEAGLQARIAESTLAVGQGQTLIIGFINYRTALRTSWAGDAAWWRSSLLASNGAKHLAPVYSVGLADGVTADPVAQMQAIGNPQDTLYGPVYQSIINGFRNAGFGKLYLRIGWEHNGEWYPWGTANPDKTPNFERMAAFVAAYRRVANIAHNTPGITVATVWSPNFERLTPEQVAMTYPGDAYVDVIAPDMYSPVWNSIPENWDSSGTSSDAEWKANIVNRQHTWDYPMATMADPTAGYGLVAMLDFALAHNKPFALGETGTDGGMSSGWYRGPEDKGDFPLYLHKRITQKMEQGLQFEYLGLWNANAYRFSGGARPADTASWVTLINLLAGADPVQAEDITAVTATDPVSSVFAPGATGNYVPDSSQHYVRESDIGGEVSVFNANAVNDAVQYVVPVPDPGDYTVKLRVRRGPAHGMYRLQIDGINQGAVQDFYRAGEDYVIVDFGRKSFPTAGNKTFRLVTTGRHASSTGYTLGVDYFDLTPDRMEAESLTNGALSDTTTVFHEAAANGGAYERLDANAVGDFIEYIVPVVEPGTYSIKVRARKQSSRGQFQMTIGGKNVGAEQDLYSPGSAPNLYTEIDFGTRRFDRVGNKVFRFTVTGRNTNSTGYFLAFDYISMTRQ